MTFWFGIGVMRLIPEGYDEYYPDEILNKLVDKLEPYLSEEIEIREALLEENVDLYTQENSTNTPVVIGAGLDWGGILSEKDSQPILSAIKNIPKIDYAPYWYGHHMPDPFADILVPGFNKATKQTSQTSESLFKSLVKLDDFCVAPLQRFKVGGLEQHITTFIEWRDYIHDDSEFEESEVTREKILDFYDGKLLPMLRFCENNHLIFVFCFA